MQLKIGEAMIKTVFIQPDDSGIGALVIAVAGFTVQSAGILVFSVEALFVANILGHRLMVMAAQAEFFLGSITQSNMAGSALGFELIVGPDQFARHEKLFNFNRQ